MRWEFSVLAEATSGEGHYKDLTETGNRARKVSGTQGGISWSSTVKYQYMKRHTVYILDTNLVYFHSHFKQHDASYDISQ